MEPFPIKLEPQSPKKFDDLVNYNNYLKLDDVNGKLLDNLKSEYTNGVNSFSIIKEEYDIPDDNHMIVEDSNNSDLENQENYSFNLESRNVHWPSKKHKQIDTAQPHKSTFDISNVAPNNSILNDKVVDVDTINNKENRSLRKHSTLKFCYYCLHCNKTRAGLRIYEKIDCVKCKMPMVAQCLKCNKQYDKLDSMRYHIQICGDPEKRFKCAQCDYKCSVLKLLRNHKRRMHDNSEEICSKCNKRFKNILSCQDHERICGRNPDFTCTLCSYKTFYKQNLSRHLRFHEKIYQKTVQNNEASVALDYLNDKHIPRLNLYSSKIQAHFQRYCSKCNKNFENNLLTNSNKCKICETRLLMRCIECKSMHNSVQAMRYHLQQQCVLKTKLECSMCGYSTINPRYLKNHIQRKHTKIIAAEQFYKCSKCPRSFKFKKYLTRHIRNNCMSNKPHLLCDHCPFKTKTKGALTNHIKSHMASENTCRKKSTNEESRSLLLLGYCSKCDVSRKVAKRSAVCLTCKIPLVFPESINVETSTQQALHLYEKKEHQHFECKDCGKAFERLSNLDCHKKVCKSKISV